MERIRLGLLLDHGKGNKMPVHKKLGFAFRRTAPKSYLCIVPRIDGVSFND
jgi:hypothetical protein